MTLVCKLILTTTICLFSLVGCFNTNTVPSPITTFDTLSLNSFNASEPQRQWRAHKGFLQYNVLHLEHFELNDSQNINFSAQALTLPLTFGETWRGHQIELRHPEFELSADHFDYNEVQNIAHFHQNINLTQDSITLQSELLSYYTKDNRFVFEDSQGVIESE